MRLYRAPEVCPLERIDVLRCAHIDSTLGVGCARFENRRVQCIRGHAVSVGENMRRIERSLRTTAIRNHDLDGDNVGCNCGGRVCGWGCAHHIVGIVRSAIGE